MEAYKEELITRNLPFPVDIFISDNSIKSIGASPHWHECYEILYMLEGTANQQVNDQCFKVIKNDMIILSHGDIHSTYCNLGENTRILVVKFLPDIIDKSYAKVFESRYILAFLSNQSSKISHVHDTSKSSKDIYDVMMGLYREFTKQEVGYEVFIKGYIYQLVACLVRNGILSIHRPICTEQDAFNLNQLLKYIEEHYKERIDLEEAAKMLNMSYFYLSRYFKKMTGRNFKEYLDFVRVCEAEKLIVTKDVNISQVAYEIGFCNVSSFNRVFKRVRGYAPREIKRTKSAKN